MPSPILARADALMQRRRGNADAEADDLPVLTDAVDAPPPEIDDDIPLLLNIETAAPIPPAPLHPEDFARDIARRVERRLAAELPNLVAAAVREYLAEQAAALARRKAGRGPPDDAVPQRNSQ